MSNKIYEGLAEDLKEGVGPTARIILDARVFGLVDDDEECTGWRAAELQILYDKVSAAWEPFGYLPSKLPDELRARHEEIYQRAVDIAREHGWDPDRDLTADEV